MEEQVIDIRLLLVALIATSSIGFQVGRYSTKESFAVHETINPATVVPSGEHLLLDMNGIDASFLGSEERLIKTMVSATESLGFTLVSCGCFASESDSFACLSASQEGRMSLYAWPERGVLLMDVFSYGNESLPILDVVVDLFKVGTNVTTTWSLDYRGKTDEPFRQLARDVLSPRLATVKEELLTTRTDNHKIDIWEVLDIDSVLSYEAATEYNLKPDDPRWTNNDLAQPVQLLFVDGEGIYSSDPEELLENELDTHPALLSHPNPQEIGIISTGEINSEWSCHKDPVLLDIIQNHFPNAFNCSDLIGRANNCMEDDIVTWVPEEGSQWFIDRYNSNTSAGTRATPFDVLFVDAETPRRAEDLTYYVDSLMRSLSPDGILAISLGISPTILHPNAEFGHFAQQKELIRTLEASPFVATMLIYDDDNALNEVSSEVSPSAWMLACKSNICRHHFYAHPEVIDAKIEERTIQRKSQKPIFEYYDGVVHQRLQVAPKTYETAYCRRDPTPVECAFRWLDPTLPIFEFDHDPDQSAFAITQDDCDTNAGLDCKRQTHVTATVDIPNGSYIMPSSFSKSLMLSDEESMQKILSKATGIEQEEVSTNVKDYGHTSVDGGDSVVLEIGPSAFIRTVSVEAEANIGRWAPPVPKGTRPKYSPVYDNHAFSMSAFMVATRDIPKGTEVVKYSL
eukprot:scaffold9895_cov108-Cylindrotheca_fusiformis.AAC.1